MSLRKTLNILWLVLVQHRKTENHPAMTEKTVDCDVKHQHKQTSKEPHALDRRDQTA